VANRQADRAIAEGLAELSRAPDPVQGSGQVDSVRYGAVLRARKLVGVRGVGARYDGLYYVQRVTHAITRDSYTQQFSVSREGTGGLAPVVALARWIAIVSGDAGGTTTDRLRRGASPTRRFSPSTSSTARGCPPAPRCWWASVPARRPCSSAS